MKKFLTILIATILATLCLAMVGCNDENNKENSGTESSILEGTLTESDVIGTYTFVSQTYTSKGETTEITDPEVAWGSIIIEIKENKTCIMTNNDGDEVDCTWKISENKLIFTIHSEKIDCSYDNGYLTYSVSFTESGETHSFNFKLKKV